MCGWPSPSQIPSAPKSPDTRRLHCSYLEGFFTASLICQRRTGWRAVWVNGSSLGASPRSSHKSLSRPSWCGITFPQWCFLPSGMQRSRLQTPVNKMCWGTFPLQIFLSRWVNSKDALLYVVKLLYIYMTNHCQKSVMVTKYFVLTLGTVVLI